MRAVSFSNTAEPFETDPNPDQLLPPSSEYSQLPLLSSTLMMARPSDEPGSTSVMRSLPALRMIDVIESPGGSTSSSTTFVSVMLPLASSTGASFTAVIVMDAVSLAAENGVAPPLTDTSTLLPSVSELWSQTRKSNEATSATSPPGTKRMRSMSRSNRALEPETVPTAFQFEPASIEYSQTPLPLVRDVTAIPSSAMASTSVTFASRFEMRSPALAGSSSLMLVKDGAEGLRVGASFTALTAMDAESVAAE